MYDYVKGSFAEINPAYAILDVQGLGYMANISLYTYSKINNTTEGKLFLHLVIREDEHLLFGFYNKEERQLFRHLISVSGVGPNTARVILSSVHPEELVHAIQKENVAQIKAVKGIGPKTAQRIIIELKDKVTQIEWSDTTKISLLNNNTYEESLSALVALGFNKAQVSETIKKIIKGNSTITVEDVIKQTLKYF